MYGSAREFPRIFIEHEFDHDTPDRPMQQYIIDNHNVAQEVLCDERLLSDEDTDFDGDMCMSEEFTPEAYTEDGDGMCQLDEREWWSTQRRWF